MILSPDHLAACEGAIEVLTGEKLKRGDTGWLEVMMRALLLGATYKIMWENKHGDQRPIGGTVSAMDRSEGVDKTPTDAGRMA